MKQSAHASKDRNEEERVASIPPVFAFDISNSLEMAIYLLKTGVNPTFIPVQCKKDILQYFLSKCLQWRVERSKVFSREAMTNVTFYSL